MDKPIPIPPAELSGPFTLEIGLDWFFDKFTRGVHGFATVSKEYGLYVQGKDLSETHLHVDFPEEAPALAYIYPKPLWIESVKRMGEMKRRSEEERAARFAREVAARELQRKFQERESEIQRILNKLQRDFPVFSGKHSMKNLRLIVISLLQGKGSPDVCKKLGIDEVTIKEFTELPQPTPTDEEVLMGLVVEKPPVNPEVRVV
jgi:hypothetical protein